METLAGRSLMGGRAEVRPSSELPGKDVARFGIRVTALAPGQLLTDWAGRAMARTPRAPGRL